jgi:DNA polymerase-3 subunit alpha
MIHLHLHSHYSTLDGLGKPDEIVAKAKAMGAPAVAITDHASLTAMPELVKHAEKAEIKPIIGCEFYVVDKAEKPGKGEKEKRYHLTVLAKSWKGVQSIMSQLTLANQQFYYRPRLTFEQALDFEDCIVMSACAIGILSHDDWVVKADNFFVEYGDDFYLEIMPHDIVDKEGSRLQQTVNERAIDLFKKGMKIVATNDAHYIERADAYTHEILLAVQTGKKWDDPKRWKWGTDQMYMKDLSETIASFQSEAPYVPNEILAEALKSTQEIADRCDVVMPKFKVHLPSIHADDDAAFAKALQDGWAMKIGGPNPEYLGRLKYEISVVKKLDFVRYFLMVDDFIRTARSRGIMVGPARGSAAGSLICYLMDIVQVDPIKHGLYFERFLNPERVDLPDIDIDFEDSRRHEVFEYARDKYGADFTANITTTGTLSMNSAFRDVARTFGINQFKLNTLSKQIEDEDSFDNVPELVNFVRASNENAEIVEQARRLVGTVRNNGVHACGYIISSEPLKNVSVIERRKDAQVVNWDKRLCESFGLLKVDFLGLSTLTILNLARRHILERHGFDIDYTKIPLTDEKTLAAFSRGEGMGIFQFENSGMQTLLRSLKADTFEVITDTTALYRPGSLESGETERYVQIAKGHRYEEYLCPQLEPILKPTKGIMVYQEQIMKIFNELGGFTWAESDKMRKIIGKKLGKDEFNKHKQHFIDGCKVNEIDESIAEAIFAKMAEFAKYSFNKSHAVAYTMISFWTMFIKVHFPMEFFAACLTVRNDEKAGDIVKDAGHMGVSIRRPDINLSTRQYEICDQDENTIIAPLGIVKGIGPKCVEVILTARKDGAFLSAEDFRDRVPARSCNVRHFDILKTAGAFESLGIREPSQSQREKNYAELLPIFDTLPTLKKQGVKLDMGEINELYKDVQFCAKDKGNSVMMPNTSKRPYIMVVNNAVKTEKQHLTNKGTRHLLHVAAEFGFPETAFYYSGAVKCCHSGKQPSNACVGTCMDFLRREIEIVKPKLIVCFSSTVLGMFAGIKKPTMGKLNGNVVYSKEFDCYVLFSYSSQYAYYNEDKVGQQFKASMSKLGEIFT